MDYISYFKEIGPGSILKLKFDDEDVYYTYYGIRVYEDGEGQLYGETFNLLKDAELYSNEIMDSCINNIFFEKCECEITIEDNELDFHCEGIDYDELLYKSEFEPIVFVSLKQCEFEIFLQYSNTLYTDYMNQGLDKLSATEYKINYVNAIDEKSEEELYFRDDEDIFCKLKDYNKMIEGQHVLNCQRIYRYYKELHKNKAGDKNM